MSAKFVNEDYPDRCGLNNFYKCGVKRFQNSAGGDGRHRENAYTSSIQIATDHEITYQKSIFPPVQKSSSIYASQTYQYSDRTARNLGKLMQSLKGHDLKLGVSLAESGKSLDSISTRLHSLGRSVRAARRGDFKRAYELAAANSSGRDGSQPGREFSKKSSAASQWLDYYYSVRPMLSDISEGVKAYENRYGMVQQNYRARSQSTGSATIFISHGWNNHSGSKGFQSKIKLSADYKLSPDEYLGLDDVPSIAWELIPGSFIIDWVLPVGQWIDAMHTVRSIVPEQVVTTSFVKESCGGCFGKGLITLTPETGSRELYGVGRAVSSSFTIPPLSFKTLSESMGNNRINLVNALALVSGGQSRNIR